MMARCRELKLRLAVPEDQARQEFTVLLTVQAMNYLHSGGHRLVPVKKVRILALVHDHLVPPDDTTGIDVLEAEWKMEYDVIETLREARARGARARHPRRPVRHPSDGRRASSRTSSST